MTGHADASYADVLLSFVRALRAAGVGCGPDRTRAFLAAVAALRAVDAATVKAAGVATCCSCRADLPVFDRVFDAFFGPPGGGPGPGDVVEVPVATPDNDAADDGDTPDDGDDGGRSAPPGGAVASRAEALRRADLAELSAEERAEADVLLRRLRAHRIERSTRRARPGRRGGLDRRATLRAAARHGGEVARLPRRVRRRSPRKVVVLVDVSGSMRPYADAYLRFAHALVASHARVEVFTLGTRLTRVTAELRRPDPAEALAALSETVVDFSGGTRLGDTLARLVDGWGRAGPLRGALVVVASDGLERGGADELGRQMRRVALLARDVVWCHPHRGRPGFAPVTAGMRAAMPHVGALLPGHRLADLESVVEELIARA